MKKNNSDPTHLRAGGFPMAPHFDEDSMASSSGAPHAGASDGGAPHPGASDGDRHTAASVALHGAGALDSGPIDLEWLLLQLTVGCRPAILNLLLDHRQELGLELGEFFSVGSALHSGGGCSACFDIERKEGCALGVECMRCHIPHFRERSARPNNTRRRILRRFSDRLGGLYRQASDEAFHAAVAGLAAAKPRFGELLQEHAGALLEAARAREPAIVAI